MQRKLVVAALGAMLAASSAPTHAAPGDISSVAGRGGARLARTADRSSARVLVDDAYASEVLSELRAPAVPGHQTVEELFLRQRLALMTPRSGGSAFVPATSAADEDGSTRYTYMRAPAFMDLDGDGYADILGAEFDVTNRRRPSELPLGPPNWEVLNAVYRFAARSGRDGTRLWLSEPLRPDGYLYHTLADADDDGVTDVVVVDTGARPEHWAAPADAGTVRLVQTVRVLSGVDGRELWTREQPASITYANAWHGYLVVEEAHGVVADVRPLDADAARPGRELLLSTIDYQAATAAPIYDVDPHGTGARVARCTTRGAVIEGSTGEATEPLVARERNACGSFTDVGDLSGDGRADVAFFSGSELELRSIDGQTTYWHRVLDGGDTWSFVEPASLTRGTARDIKLVGINFYLWYQGPTFQYLIKQDHLAGFAGGSGTTLFDLRTDGYALRGGSIDPDGGEDFYDVEVTHQDRAVGFRAFAGSSGATLWTRREATSDERVHVVATSLADVDGNGSRDPLVVTSTYDGGGHRIAAEADMWNGSDGGTLWHTVLADGDSIPFRLYGAGPHDSADADGDGRADLAQYEERDGHTTITAVNGMTRAPITSVAVPPGGIFWLDWGMYELGSRPSLETFVIRWTQPAEHHYDMRYEIYDEAGEVWSADVSSDFE